MCGGGDTALGNNFIVHAIFSNKLLLAVFGGLLMSFDVLLARSSAAKVHHNSALTKEDGETAADGSAADAVAQPSAEALLGGGDHNESTSSVTTVDSPSSGQAANNGKRTRKVSTYKIMSTFANLYGGGGGAAAASNDENETESSTNGPPPPPTECAPTNGGMVQQRSYDDSFPEIKGRVESKLMSMWHNVKYGELRISMPGRGFFYTTITFYYTTLICVIASNISSYLRKQSSTFLTI